MEDKGRILIVEDEKAVLWIKMEDKQTIRLEDRYVPTFYVRPKNKNEIDKRLHNFYIGV